MEKEYLRPTTHNGITDCQGKSVQYPHHQFALYLTLLRIQVTSAFDQGDIWLFIFAPSSSIPFAIPHATMKVPKLLVVLVVIVVTQVVFFSATLTPPNSFPAIMSSRVRRSIHSLPPSVLRKDTELPEIPPSPEPLSDDVPEEIREWLELMDSTRLSPKQQKEYDDSLSRHRQNIHDLAAKWSSDPNATCFRESHLPCDILPGLDDTLPPGFSGACAPGFIISGTAKSGTTSLYYYLVQHPQVNQALSGIFHKEVRYFTDHWYKGTSWYLQQFPPVSPYDIIFPEDTEPRAHMINGEASPTYFTDRYASSRIKAVTPNAKLIVLLRNPIDRAYSEKQQLLSNDIFYIKDPYEDMKYQIQEYRECIAFLKQHKNFTDPTDEYLHCYKSPMLSGSRLKSDPYVLNSLYIHQVRNFLRYFPLKQLLFIKSEDMYENPGATMDKVTDFLGLCRWEWSEITSKIYNRKKEQYTKMSPELRTLLGEFFEEYNNQLYDEIGIDFNWTA